jgi:hypothetical protein
MNYMSSVVSDVVNFLEHFVFSTRISADFFTCILFMK